MKKKAITLSVFDKYYKVLRKIGSGSFGGVHLIEEIETKRQLALKKIKLRENEKLESILRQIQIQDFLAHSLVPKIFEFYVFDTKHTFMGKRQQVGIVMELGKRSLAELIEDQNSSFLIEEIITFAHHFIKLFAFFQDQKVVHRDIKPSNFIQFGEGLQCKLIDFGVSSHVNDITSIAGTFNYFSPKLKRMCLDTKLKDIKNPYKDDVYSFGLTLYELITRTIYLNRIKQSNDRYAREVYRLTRNDDITNLIEFMLDQDEQKRPDFKQLFDMFEGRFLYYEQRLRQIRGGNRQQESSRCGFSNYSTVAKTRGKNKQNRWSINDNVRRTYKQENVFENEDCELKTVKNFEKEKGYEFVEDSNNRVGRFRHEEEQWSISYRKAYYGQENLLQNDQSYFQGNSKLEIEQSPNDDQIISYSQNHNQVMESINQQSVEQVSNQVMNQSQQQMVYNKIYYHFGSRIQIRSVLILKSFIMCGCQDGSVWVINTISMAKKGCIYRIQGMKIRHSSPITVMSTDRWGRLWTGAEDGLVLLWDAQKLFTHLYNQDNYKQVFTQCINNEGTTFVMQDNFIQMDPDVSSVPKQPHYEPRAISALYCMDDGHFVIGYIDGRVYSVWNGVELYYQAHSQSVTAIKQYENDIYTASIDGTIKVLSLEKVNFKQSYFTSQLAIRDFIVSGDPENPDFLIATADNRGFCETGWKIELSDEENQRGEMQISAVVFINDNIFSTGINGELYRNGKAIEKFQGSGWSCIDYNGRDLMVLGSTEGELIVIYSN